MFCMLFLHSFLHAVLSKVENMEVTMMLYWLTMISVKILAFYVEL